MSTWLHSIVLNHKSNLNILFMGITKSEISSNTFTYCRLVIYEVCRKLGACYYSDLKVIKWIR